MTYKEAIKQLRSLRTKALVYAESEHQEGDYDTVFDKDVEALDMVITALAEMSERQTSSGSGYGTSNGKCEIEG